MTHLSEVPDGVGLRRAFAHFPSGVVAVCAEIDGQRYGIAVSTFVPVSLDPPLVSFCVQNTSATWQRLSQVDRLGLSLLGLGQEHAARAFGTRGGERFRDIEVYPGNRGAVFIGGASAWLEGTVDAQVPAGDHKVVLLRVDRLATAGEVEPLVFHGSRFRRLHVEEAVAS